MRFADDPEGARAILEACDIEGSVTITIEAAGSDRDQALSALAERTRALHGGVCGVVETVEEIARTYFAGAEEGA